MDTTAGHLVQECYKRPTLGLIGKVYQGWEPILAQTMLPKASSPTTTVSTFPFTFNFFVGDSFKGFSSLLQETSVAAAAAFWAEVAGRVFDDAGLFAVLVDDAFGVAVDEDGVGAGDNDAGRLVDDGDGDGVALLLSFPDLPWGDLPILAGESPVGALLYVPENLQSQIF